MTENNQRLIAVLCSLAFVVGVLLPRVVDGGFSSPALWWGILAGVLLGLAAIVFGRWRKRQRAEASD